MRSKGKKRYERVHKINMGAAAAPATEPHDRTIAMTQMIRESVVVDRLTNSICQQPKTVGDRLGEFFSQGAGQESVER